MKATSKKRAIMKLGKAAKPALYAYIRASFRLCIALGFYVLGYHHVAFVFCILAAMSVLAVVENQLAKTLADLWPEIKNALARRLANRFPGKRPHGSAGRSEGNIVAAPAARNS